MASRPSKKSKPPSKGSRGPAPARLAWLWVLPVLLVLGVAAALWRHGWDRPPSKMAAPAGGLAAADAATGAGIEPEARVFARYAGSDDCGDCHAQEHDIWARSNHGMAERLPGAALDLAAFQPAVQFQHGTQRSEARMNSNHFEVVTTGFEGRVEPYRVERVIGHDPLRQFLVAGAGGRWQTLEATYDPHRREWFNVYGNEDRQPGEWGHWTGRGMTWNGMCASCHNTRLRKNYDEASDTYRTAMAERTVGCESCHGPMKDHAAWRRRHPAASGPDPTVPRRTKAQTMDTCGGCHARRYELTGDFQPGGRFDDHYALTIVDSSELYYPDGQVREEDYEYASFLGSRMHAAGITCVDCHHPHLARPMLEGNALCMRCHSGGYTNSPVIDPARHTFHDLQGPGGQCVNCHMPQTTYMQRHARHDHGFTIPDPLLTRELGIPNACNRCHKDQDTAWALAAVEQWYGSRMDRPSRSRARTIAAARRGNEAAREPLIQMLQGETPYWAAVAANLLDLWAAHPSATRALTDGLGHSNGMVRACAVRGLAPLIEDPRFPHVRTAVGRMLEDEVRHVRHEAAWALRGELDPGSKAGQELRQALDFNADFPSGQMQKGAYESSRRRPDLALAHYEKAVVWDPNSAALRHELAVVLSMVNRPADALAQLRHACRLAPAEAEYWYKSGLVLHELGNGPESIQAMEKAVELNPRHGRAWYNLGLAKQQAGQADAALDALARGETAAASDPDIPYARATILAQLGRYDEARAAAMRALDLQAEFPEARALLRSLP